MQYDVSLSGAVDFAPQGTAEEIIQNVRTIILTRVGDVPLDRSLGVSWDFVDLPMPVAKARLRESIIDAVEAFEPRARVVGVSFSETNDTSSNGVLLPNVSIEIVED